MRLRSARPLGERELPFYMLVEKGDGNT